MCGNILSPNRASLYELREEVLTESDGEEKTTKERVLERRDEEGACAELPVREDDAAGEGESYGYPVAKDDVHEGEGEGAQKNQYPLPFLRGCAQQRPAAMHEEDAVDDALGINGKHRIKNHEDCPDSGVSEDEAQEQVAVELVDEAGERRGGDDEEGEDRHKLIAERPWPPELPAVEGAVVQEHGEAIDTEGPEDRKGRDAWPVKGEEQRNRDEDGRELGNEQCLCAKAH